MTAPRLGRIALLYDCTYPHVAGGGQKRLFEVFRRLVQHGWDVDWYGLKAWAGDGPEIVGGINFIPVAPATALYGPDGKRAIGQTVYYGAAIARYPRLGGYDIIHLGQWPYFHFFPARLFALFGGAKLTADWWEVWGAHWKDYYGAKGYLGMGLEKTCARIPQKLVAISETGARQLGEIGVKPNRIDTIHNGIDFAAIAQAVPAAAASDIVYLGRLQPHKNVNLLIEALAILKGRGQSLALSIIGDGPEMANLRAIAERIGVAPQICWLGSIESDAEVHAHLRASRIFVHPSTKEGGGSITSLEANAAGLPVVAFSCPGGISSELIAHGQNGVWVVNVDAASLADGIMAALKLSDAPTTVERCAAFASDFDWGIIASHYHRIFSEMAKVSRPAATE